MTTIEVLRFFFLRNPMVAQGILEGYIGHDKVEIDEENGYHKLIRNDNGDEIITAWVVTDHEDQEEVKLVETLTENFSLTQLESEGMRRVLYNNFELREDLTKIFLKSLMS